jgi:hypothetical protein
MSARRDTARPRKRSAQEIQANVQVARMMMWTRIAVPLAVGLAIAVCMLAFLPIAQAITDAVRAIAGKETDFNAGIAISIGVNIVVGGAAAVAYVNQRGRLRSQREQLTKYEQLLGIADEDAP